MTTRTSLSHLQVFLAQRNLPTDTLEPLQIRIDRSQDAVHVNITGLRGPPIFCSMCFNDFRP